MIFYKDLGWGDDDAATLAEALKWIADHCDLSAISRLSLNFRENEFTSEGKQVLENAVGASTKIVVRVHVVDEPEL